jgi:WD40 repeat protein/serine/threonine protein kinase
MTRGDEDADDDTSKNVGPHHNTDPIDEDLDQTIEEGHTIDLDATIEKTDDFDPNATVEEARQFDPDATVAETPEFDPNLTVVESRTVDHSAITVRDTSGTDATIDLSEHTRANTDKAFAQTKGLDETAETLASVSAGSIYFDTQEGNVQSDGNASLLDDTNLGQTINPRALSEAEAKYWSEISSEFTSPSEPTAMPPAIDRTIVETRLQLRHQTVATQIHGDADASDYRLVRLLGRGGMGNVFVARQGSLDRLIAVKVIRPLEESKRKKLAEQGKLEKVEQSRRQQFLSEAVVTGDLDHPNIVPIHDVAVTGDSTLFYSMKRVVGTPWSDVMNEKSRDENIEILIKVADAIGFAHTRGVVHRDIKPENVMLGDFGVVMVMDWGIALAKPEFAKLDSITPATGLGGTPSMMAPEMVIGPIEKIGPAADIYLLGATLFMIITGTPPHQAANVSQCLRAVADNEIREFDQKHCGELMNIALKAMSSNPSDRYADVTKFQEALREYRSHAESIALTSRASEDFKLAGEHHSYTQFTRAQFGFEESLALWSGNETAREGLRQTKLAHAEAAYHNEDFDLGLSLLDENNPEHTLLIEKLHAALKLRRQRESRFGILKKVAAALLAIVLIGGSVAIVVTTRARSRADRNAAFAKLETKRAEEKTAEVLLEKKRADDNLVLAQANEAKAITNATEAMQQRDRADETAIIADRNATAAKRNAEEAIRNAQQAKLAQAAAEYESYVSGVALAKTRIDRNEFTEARRLIEGLIGKRESHAIPWELRYLSSLASQSTESVSNDRGLVGLTVAKATSGTTALVQLDNGAVAMLNVKRPLTQDDDHDLLSIESSPLLANENVTCLMLSPDAQNCAAGTSEGDVLLFDPTAISNEESPGVVRRLKGHRGRVTDVEWVDESTVISSSEDRTIQIWNLEQATSEETLWHIAPVVDVAVSKSEAGYWIAAAISEKDLGQVVLWKVQAKGKVSSERLGVFAEHTRPLTSVAMSKDGTLAASGDVDGNVLLWPVSQIRQRDVTSLVKRAVQVADDLKASDDESDHQQEAMLYTSLQSVDSERNSRPLLAHRSTIRNIQFSGDAKTLLTCGDDYLVRLWKIELAASANNAPSCTLLRMLRGHGGPVTDASFLGEDGGRVLSVSADQSARLWVSAADNNVAQEVLKSNLPARPSSDALRTRVHDDEIWAADLSADGWHVVTASRDRTAKVLAINPRTWQLSTTSEFTTDDDPPTGLPLLETAALSEGTEHRAMSMRVNRSVGQLFVGGADAIVRVWDINRGTELGRIPDTGLNQMLAVSANTRVILTGSNSPPTRAILWQFDPKMAIATVKHRLGVHEESVASVAISADSLRAATADRAGRIVLWDVNSGQPIGTPIDLMLGTRVNDVTFSPDGESLWIAADDQRLSRLSFRTRQIVDRLDHDGFVTQVALSKDGRRAITTAELQKVGSTIHEAVFWQLPTESGLPAKRQTVLKMTVEKNARTRRGGRPGIASVALDEVGVQAVVAVNPPGNAASRVERWRIDDDVTQIAKEDVLGLPEPLGDVSSAVPLTTNELLTLHGNSAYRWNTNARSLELSYRMNGTLSAVVFSPDDEIVLTGSRSVKAWDAASGKAIGKLESPHQGAVRSLAFVAADQRYEFFTGGDDGMVHRWSFDREKAVFEKLATFKLDNEASETEVDHALSLTISPDASQLLITTDRGRVILQDRDQQTLKVLFSDPAVGEIHAGCFSADGRFVAAGGRDRLARLWDLSQQRSADDPPDAIFQGHAEAIRDLSLTGRFNEDPAVQSTLRLCTVAQDRSLRVWDPRLMPHIEGHSKHAAAQVGRELLELVQHRDGVTAIELNSDGDLMMTAGRDGNVILWPALTQ